jgi:hypothetical protein
MGAEGKHGGEKKAKVTYPTPIMSQNEEGAGVGNGTKVTPAPSVSVQLAPENARPEQSHWLPDTSKPRKRQIPPLRQGAGQVA